MILPTKHVEPDRALIGIGAEVLTALDRPMTMSRLWDRLRERRTTLSSAPPLDYDWYVLSLDLLYALAAIEFDRGLLRKARP